MSRMKDHIHDVWDRCVGASPGHAVELALQNHETPRQFAEAYLAQWPHEEPPPDDLVEVMVVAMETYMSAHPLCQGCGSDVPEHRWNGQDWCAVCYGAML